MPTLGALTKRMAQHELTLDLEDLLLAIGQLEERLRWFENGPPHPSVTVSGIQAELTQLRHQLLEIKGSSQTSPSSLNPLVTQSLNHPVTQPFSRLENLKGSIRNQPPELGTQQPRPTTNPVTSRDTTRVPSPLAGESSSSTPISFPQTGESSSIPSPLAGEGQGEGVLFRWSAATQASSQHPARNEDRWLAVPEASGFGVFDGIGGDQASVLVHDQVEEAYQALASDPHPPELTKALQATLLEAHFDLQRRDEGSAVRLATTATLAVVTRVGQEVIVTHAHVGDSRLSHWHKSTGQFRVMTFDDGLLAMLLKDPTIRPAWVASLLTDLNLDANLHLSSEATAKAATVLDLHPDPRKVSLLLEALFRERNLVSQSLGNGRVQPHAGQFPVQAGDRLLLATDGVHDNLTEMEIKKVVADAPLKEAAQKLVAAASSVSQSAVPRAKPDDITAIVIEIR